VQTALRDARRALLEHAAAHAPSAAALRDVAVAIQAAQVAARVNPSAARAGVALPAPLARGTADVEFPLLSHALPALRGL
jgi:hypothetical protein